MSWFSNISYSWRSPLHRARRAVEAAEEWIKKMEEEE
jgi:hypothetical protein|tara:strand:- start:279 stop:389 length:111 start_codon:yes stop_codon:yes gene_type:complete